MFNSAFVKVQFILLWSSKINVYSVNLLYPNDQRATRFLVKDFFNSPSVLVPHFRCEVGEQAKSLFQDRAAWKLPSPGWWPSPRGGKTKENPNLSPLTLSLSFSYQPDQICYSLLLKQSLPFTHVVWVKNGKLFPFSIWALKSRMVSYFHPLRTVWGLWNQGWQAIPIFENSIWSLKSRMPAIPTFWGEYVILYQNMVDCWLPLGFEARRWVGEGWRAV